MIASLLSISRVLKTLGNYWFS